MSVYHKHLGRILTCAWCNQSYNPWPVALPLYLKDIYLLYTSRIEDKATLTEYPYVDLVIFDSQIFMNSLAAKITVEVNPFLLLDWVLSETFWLTGLLICNMLAYGCLPEGTPLLGNKDIDLPWDLDGLWKVTWDNSDTVSRLLSPYACDSWYVTSLPIMMASMVHSTPLLLTSSLPGTIFTTSWQIRLALCLLILCSFCWMEGWWVPEAPLGILSIHVAYSVLL